MDSAISQYCYIHNQATTIWGIFMIWTTTFCHWLPKVGTYLTLEKIYSVYLQESLESFAVVVLVWCLSFVLFLLVFLRQAFFVLALAVWNSQDTSDIAFSGAPCRDSVPVTHCLVFQGLLWVLSGSLHDPTAHPFCVPKRTTWHGQNHGLLPAWAVAALGS